MFASRVFSAILLAFALFASASGLQGQSSTAPEIVTVLKGHADTIEAIALSPDGTLVATGCFDRNIRLFELASGREIRSYGGPQGHTGQVLSVAFNTKGDQLVSGGADNTARIWDVPVGFPGKTFSTSGAATRVIMAQDGKTFCVAGADGITKLFPLGDEKGAIEFKGHTGAVTQLGLSGTTWISAGADKTIRFWTTDGKQSASYLLGTTDVTGMVVGQSIYTTSSDNILRTWQLPPQPIRSFPILKEAVTAFYASADGNTLLFATADKIVTLGTTANNTAASTFSGAKGPVDIVSFSPDANTILAGCSDGTLTLWERQGKVKAELSAHDKGVSCGLFHPSQQLLFTAGGDGLVKGWNLPIDPKQPKDKAVKHELKAHTGRVTGLLIHPGTGQLITAGADKLIRFWDLAKPDKAVKEIGPLVGAVTNLTLSRDGQLLAGTVGKDVLLWNAADGKELGKLTQTADVVSLSLSVDKTRILLGRADNLAALVDASTGAVLQAYPHAAAVRGVLIHPNLPQVVTASADKTVVISPIAVQRITPLGGKVSGIAISPGLDRLVTFGPGKECVSWLSGNGQKDKTFPTDGEAISAAFSKDGQRIAVSGADGSVKLYTVVDGKLIGFFLAGGPVTEMAFHPTAPLLAGLVKNVATVWNIAFQTGQPLPADLGKAIQTFPHPKGVSSPVFNGEGLLFTAGEDKLVRRFRIASDLPVKNLQHPNLVDCAAFDDTGNLVATGCHDGILRIWDIAKNTPIKTINAHVVTTPQQIQNPIYAVVWTPDYKQVFSASYDRSIKLWDVASGNLVREFKPVSDSKPEEKKIDKKDDKKEDKKDDKKDVKKDEKKDEKKDPPKKEPTGPPGHRDAVFVLALSKDGKFLASGSSDKSVKLWEVATGKVIRDFPNPDLKPVFPDEPAPSHPGWIHGVRFTPDGQFLVTAGAAPRYKSYLAVWNVADGKRVFGAERDYGSIHSLAITNDGTRLILGCEAPRGRTEPDAIIIKFPEKTQTQGK